MDVNRTNDWIMRSEGCPAPSVCSNEYIVNALDRYPYTAGNIKRELATE